MPSFAPDPDRISAWRWVLTVLRGISQVFLVRNAASGLLMLAGIATYSPRMAALVTLGSVVGAVAGAAAGRRDVRDGLMGYNGALVGAAAHLDLAATGPAACATVVGAAACLPVHLLLERIFHRLPVGGRSLPVLTAPFCAVAGALTTTVHGLPGAAAPLETGEGPLREGALGLVGNVAQVFLTDGIAAGLLILAALFVADVRVGLWAAFGSLVAVGAGLQGWDPASLSAGLSGYSSCLVGVAVGATFLPGSRATRRLGWVLVGSVAAVAVTAVLHHTPVPVYTWPFVLVTWVVLAAAFGRRPASADETV